MASEGKRVLITGSSRGIGRGIARTRAQQGARVAVHYYEHEAAAQETLGLVRDAGGDGLVVQADVARPEDIKGMFRRVRDAFGGLDIFVSNARPELPHFFAPPLEITLQQWDAACA